MLKFLLFVMVVVTTNEMDISSDIEPVTIFVEQDNLVYQLIGIISDSSDDDVDNLPSLYRTMPKYKQTMRKIHGLQAPPHGDDSTSSEESSSDPDERPFNDPSWSPGRRSPARSREPYKPSPRKHRGRGGRRGGRGGRRGGRPRPQPRPNPRPPVPVPPAPVPPAPVPPAPVPPVPVPPANPVDPPEPGADPQDPPEPVRKPDPNAPASTGTTPERPKPGTPRSQRVPTPPPPPPIRDPTPERKPDPNAPASTGTTPTRVTPGTPKTQRVPTPPPLPPIREPTPERPPRVPTPPPPPPIRDPTPEPRVPTPPPVPPIRVPTPEPRIPTPPPPPPIRDPTPEPNGQDPSSDSDGEPQPVGSSRKRKVSSSSDENGKKSPAKRSKPDRSLRPPLITPTPGTGTGTPRKRIPLSQLKGFAREARLRERRRLDTAFTTKRGYFKVPDDYRHWSKSKKLRMSVRHYQTSQEILIPPLPFARFVRELLQDAADEMYGGQYGTLPAHEQTYFRICPEAIFALQEATEAYMVGFFAVANLLAIHAKRVAVMPKDIELAKIVRGSDHVGGTKADTGGPMNWVSKPLENWDYSFIDYPYKPGPKNRTQSRRWHHASRRMSLPRKLRARRPKVFKPKDTMTSVTPGLCMSRLDF